MANKKEPKKIKGVYLHKSGRWTWRFQYDHKCYCGYADSQKEAAEALEKAKYEIKAGTYYNPAKETLNEFFDNWFETCVLPAKKTKTADTYKRLYDLHIAPEFGMMQIGNINDIMLQKWINKLAKEYSAQTVKLIRTIFDMILESARKKKRIKENPMDLITMPALKVADKKEALTAEQERLFFQYCTGHKYEVLYRLAALTGARIGELTALQWNDVNLKEGYIDINKTLCKSDEHGFMFNSPKSRAGIRQIDLTPGTVKMLQQYIANDKADRLRNGTRKERDDMRYLLFHTGTLAPLPSSAVNNALKKIADRMRADGIDLPANFTTHTLRHCWVTRSLEIGVNPIHVSVQAGHSDKTITFNKYSSSDRQKAREEFRKVGDRLLG